MPTPDPQRTKTVKNILWIALLTGTLDGLAAMILNYKLNPVIIFKFIAYGMFGKAAGTGGAEMFFAGIVFHYIIALAFSAAFYLLYPFFKSGLRNKYLVAFIYGLTAWIVMNLIVIPLSKIGFHPVKVEVILEGMFTLIVCIGLPIALIADKQLSKEPPLPVKK